MTTEHDGHTITARERSSNEAPDCSCQYRLGNYGRLYGISMGEGWIRTTTNPTCPQHNPEKTR